MNQIQKPIFKLFKHIRQNLFWYNSFLFMAISIFMMIYSLINNMPQFAAMFLLAIAMICVAMALRNLGNAIMEESKKEKETKNNG
jgi:uncharacterized membrane protein